MMNIENRLRAAWNAELGEQFDLAGLTARVRRHRRRRCWQRVVEVMLTTFVIALFAHALTSQTMGPAHWLLLPFFAVFLPTAWILVLRSPRLDSEHAAAPTAVYAQLRLVQLKTSLRDLWFSRWSAQGLLIYSVVAGIGAWLFGDALWREAALWLLVYALAWMVAILLLARRLGQDRQRECLNLRDLLES